VACIALAAGGSFVLFEFVLPGKVPAELVGRWHVDRGPMPGMTLEFRRNGTMIGKAIIDGKEGIIEGTAEVNGNILSTTTTNPFSRRLETGTQKIITLTQTEFVTEDQSGTRVTMIRAR
jgi:uncharacterized protein (TIGR03066 family)